jgi:hypothetical protein
MENVVDRILTAPLRSPGPHLLQAGRGALRREVSGEARLPTRSGSTAS